MCSRVQAYFRDVAKRLSKLVNKLLKYIDLDHMDIASLTTDPLKKARMGNAESTMLGGSDKQQFTRLKEFSVVYTGAALNLMSQEFQQCMRDMSSLLKSCCEFFQYLRFVGLSALDLPRGERQSAVLHMPL
jgi:hypothetical protein